MDYFDGKVALITGSARGIGLATARELGRRGARIVLSDVLDDVLADAAGGLAEERVEILARRTDVTRPASCRALVRAALKRFGQIDILVNNAGISIVDRFESCSSETCRTLVEVNLLGSINMTLASLDALKDSKGHLIFVSSVSGIRAIPTGAVYSASKAALRSLAESLRLELREYGIHVGVISPGFTPTEASKTVMTGSGQARPIDRPAHDTPEGVALGITKLIEGRERERVLTPLGKATAILQRLSPSLMDHLLSWYKIKN